MPRAGVALVFVVGLVVGGLVGWQLAPSADPEPDNSDPLPSYTAPVDDNRATPSPSASPSPEAIVRVAVGDDLQRLVDTHPPGTTYLVAAGIHREQSVIPSDGDTFLGEPGAVLRGSRDLTAAPWTADGGTWFVDGQTQEGLVHGEIRRGGNQRHRHPEELWADGDRFEHVASVAELGPGRWFLDYPADRLWIGEDPAAFSNIEVSTTVGAFGGNGVTGVTIENLTIERYATPTQHGAIGFHDQHWTHDWTVRDVTVRDNHGAGIRLGPGMTIDGCLVANNGQIGIAGDGVNLIEGGDNYAAPVTIRNCEITGNGMLDFRWNWEAGGVKIKHAEAGATVVDNWIHDNGGTGLWFDSDDVGVTARSNLVESNGRYGIFTEVTFGPSLLLWNTVRGNGPSTPDAGLNAGVGIFVASSGDVDVRGNLVTDQALGILLLGQDRGTSSRIGRARLLHDVVVEDNRVEATIAAGIIDRLDGAVLEARNRFVDNLYVARNGVPLRFYAGNEDQAVAWDAWQALDQDPSGELVTDPLGLPAGAVSFRPLGRYGAPTAVDPDGAEDS